MDGQKAFDCSAHLLFEKVETPHTFLLENRRAFDENPFENVAAISDVISFFHQMMRLPIKEPARTKAALAHLEAGVAQAKEMWKFILAETDDDNEWIPNPKQTGVVGVKVTQEMVDAWLETLDEAEQVLKGKKLIPFWRGKEGGARREPAPRLHRAADVRPDRVGAGDGGHAVPGEGTADEARRPAHGNATQQRVRRPLAACRPPAAPQRPPHGSPPRRSR